MRRRPLFLLGALTLLAVEPARAQDYEDVDFGLRLTSAFGFFPRYSDTAALGGASVAGARSSSVNPAATAWKDPPGDRGVAGSLPLAVVSFDEGTRLTVLSESFVWKTEGYGTLQPSFSQVTSNDASTKAGPDFELDLIYADVQWADRLDDRTAVGVNLNVLAVESRFDTDASRVAKGEQISYGVRAGVLNEPLNDFRLGLTADYAVAPTDDSTYPPSGKTTEKKTIQRLIVRPGAAYDYAPSSTAYLDYDFGLFFDRRDTLRVHRIRAGAEHQVLPYLKVRGGGFWDVERGDTSWTVGLGIYPSSRVLIGLTYQHDFFPELDPELGSSDTVYASFTLGL